MGKVIAIKDATRVSSSDPVLTFIDECYSRLAQVSGFSARVEQRELSYQICKALVCGEPLLAEAPTGTGKTLAYLIGAIAAGEKLRGIKDIPIVVATATVGLQTQILTGDLPKLVAAGIITPSQYVLAKGRGRYFCVNSAERITAAGAASLQDDFFDAERNEEDRALADISGMLEAWNSKSWTGDVDSYSTSQGAWEAVAATSETCVGHKCEHYSTCSFFVARRALSSARIVIANHNLVLSDLTMAAEGSDPLFPGSKYLVVFDEAHHLPDKALEVGTATLAFTPTVADLHKMAAFTKIWTRNPELVRIFERQKLSQEDFETGSLLNLLAHAKELLTSLPVEEATGNCRFEQGVLPEELKTTLSSAFLGVSRLLKCVKDAGAGLKQVNLSEKSAVLGGLQVELLYHVASLSSQLTVVLKALSLLTAETRAVRWLSRVDGAVSLSTAPLEGADVLKTLLWNNERVSCALVSATVQDFHGFSRFISRSGAPETIRTHVLPHIFPYRENTLYLMDMVHSPRQDEREGFIRELQQLIPTVIHPDEGTLLLFPSKQLMREALPELRRIYGDKVLSQFDLGIKPLIELHKQRIDEGEGSILCGLATLAEGLDLPGKYCTHVVICVVPFTVPTSPVEAELQEVLGPDYFEKRALPDALIKLVQMAGRLMRRESDRGRITAFDKRLLYSKWGRKILSAIPPFRRQILRPGTMSLDDLVGPYSELVQGHAPSKRSA